MVDRFVRNAPPQIVHALGGAMPTDQQWEAISAPLEPAVLIAGAGSGKTAVMAARIVWLIVEGHAKASEILGLTFTNKAAANLLERVRAAIAPLGLPEAEEPTIQTYHAFASSLIADYGLRAGVEPGLSLMSEAQAWQLCAELFSARTYQHLEVRSLYHVGSVRQLADDCANHLVSPQSIIEHDRAFLQRIADGGKAAKDVLRACRERMELADVVTTYQAAKRARNVIDFGDQIAIACGLAADERVAADFRARYKVALLDEYQDTNHAQSVMLRALMPDGFPVMAVGDPDQNIYAWRGASLHNLLAFSGQFTSNDAPAKSMPLVVNFRSGASILSLANTLIEGVHESRRPKDKVLLPYEALGAGEVAIFLAADQVAEAERIADEAVRAHDAGTPWREIAVLCRKKRLFASVIETFRERQIPLEVIGLGGLLRTPEVTDLVALLRVLEDPLRNVALARLLMGPKWRIGYRDLALVARYAAGLNKELHDQLAREFEGPADVGFSLAEALASLDAIEGLSDDARARLERFNAELATLRAQTALPLPELARRALDMLGLERELDASPSPAAPAAKRNLANFMDRVAAFAPLEGEPTLGALVEWLDAIEESDEDIEAAQPTEDDSVKLMTIHQAKGLEYDLVFVPGMAAGERSKLFPDTDRQANPASSAKYMPFELRGDRAVLPTFMGNLADFKRLLAERALEEERRLLYVAVTRARKRLVCSAAHWYYPSGWGEALQNPMGPSMFFNEIAEFPGVGVIERVQEPPEPNPLIERRRERAMEWPRPALRAPDPLFPDGLAAAVADARASTPEDHTLFPPEPAMAPAQKRALTVTSVVTYATCPKRFYWSSVRPLPRRGSAAARIGTIVHSWIEQEGRGQISLVDPTEFEEHPDASVVSKLKDAFRASRFAGRAPVMAERSFSLVIGDYVVQGRIDAIFGNDDGSWEIVDWKSGRAPESEGAEQWQLDLYALAAQEIWGKSADQLTVTFCYLGDGSERTQAAHPAAEIRARLGTMVDSIAAGAFEPVPSRACVHCDFRRDCAEGSAFLADM